MHASREVVTAHASRDEVTAHASRGASALEERHRDRAAHASKPTAASHQRADALNEAALVYERNVYKRKAPQKVNGSHVKTGRGATHVDRNLDF